MIYYTGIGSRKVPANIITIMVDTASYLAKAGFILRSGGADGSDKAFEKGHIKIVGNDKKQIFYANDCTEQAMALAESFHPAWNRCEDFAKKLHGRNSMQVLGPELLTPSIMVICWTPDGCVSHSERTIKTGGTGTAISIASYYDIPVLNLQRDDHLKRIKTKIYGGQNV